jgi:hypothetical protein
MDYVSLKSELDNDPKKLGYADYSEQTHRLTIDQDLANLLNKVGLSKETAGSGVIQAYKVVNACVYSELELLTPEQQAILTFIVSAGQVDVGNLGIKALFNGLFEAGTQTRANLQALAVRSASRAEMLFGRAVSLLDVHKARRLK